jgi:hypothetical protein
MTSRRSLHFYLRPILIGRPMVPPKKPIELEGTKLFCCSLLPPQRSRCLCCSKVVLVGVALGGRPAHVLDAGVRAAAPWVVRVGMKMMPLRRLLRVGGMVLVLVLLVVVLWWWLVVRGLLQRRRQVRMLLVVGMRRRSVPRMWHLGRPCGGPGGNDAAAAAARRPRG